MFLSTAEKLGAALLELLAPALLDGLLLDGVLLEELLDGLLLEPDAALPPEDDDPDEPLDMPDEPLELEPDAAGADDLSLLVLLEELCAIAALDSAKSAAATAALNTLRFNIGCFLLRKRVGKNCVLPCMQDMFPDERSQPA